MQTGFYTMMKSPVGALLLAATHEGICRIEFGGEAPDGWKRADRELARARREPEEYFAGKRRRFELELALEGTEFQRAVWDEVSRVPYGTTLTYRELARRVGKPQAVRAAGAANGQNPIAIVIPCHRIVGSGGELRGYGGGLDVKRFLLELEAAKAKPQTAPAATASGRAGAPARAPRS